MLRVVLSMTTIPSRVHTILPVLTGLLKGQTFAFDQLCLVVPDRCSRQHSAYNLPSAVTDLCNQDARFCIVKTSTDWGPGTKIVPLLQREHLLLGAHQKTLIISVDDDVLLEAHAVEELVFAHRRQPSAVLGFMGAIGSRFVHAEHLQEDFQPVEALGGYRAILYPLTLCYEAIVPVFTSLHAAHLAALGRPVMDDDHALQQCEVSADIPRLVVRTKYPCLVTTPETKLVSGLNIRFLTNHDGISAPNDPEQRIAQSRIQTELFFSTLKQQRLLDLVQNCPAVDECNNAPSSSKEWSRLAGPQGPIADRVC